MLFRNDKDKNDKKDGRDGQGETVPLLALARADRLPAPGISDLRRPSEVDQGSGSRRGAQAADPAGRAEGRQGLRPGPAGHLRHRHARGGGAVAASARRHRQGAARGQAPRAYRALRRRGGILPGRSRADRRGLRPHDRGRGADPFGQRDLRQLRAAEQENSARDGDLDRRGRRSGLPGRQAGRTSGHQARGQAGAARMLQSGRAAGEDPRLHALRTGNPGGRKTYPLAGQEADGEDPEGVLPQRADAGDSEGIGRERRIQERDPGARREAAPEEDAGRGAREMRARDQEAEDDVADVGRGDRGAQLPRLVPRPALVRVHRGQARHQGSRAHPGGRPLRAGQGQAAHPRIPRGADPGRPDEGAHPVPGRTSGRRQDFARKIDRARHRTQVRARLAGRSA